MGMRGWWSDMILKCESPAMKTLHFTTSHEMTTNSSFMMAYWNSARVRKRNPPWTRANLLSVSSCCRTNPMPCLLLSVLNLVTLLGSKNASVGTVVRATFARLNAWSWLGVQVNSFFMLSRGWSGDSRELLSESLPRGG